VVLDNEAKALIEQIAKYEEQRVAARLQVAALADIQKGLRGDDPPMGAFLFGEANDTVLEGMSTSLTQARQKLTDLESRFSEAAPDVKEQRAQVEAQLEGVRNYVTSRMARAQENLGAVNGIIGQFEQRLKKVPAAELGLAQLSRESEVYSRTYSYLLERQQQAAIVKASRLSKNRVLDLPEVPLRESSPKLVLRFASGFAALALAMALVALRAVFGGRIQSELDAQRSIEGRQIFGVVPKRRWRKRSQLDPDLDAPAGGDEGRFVEAFRTIRTMLYRAVWSPEPGGKVVLITSPAAGDGKTTCTWALASVLAADGKKVLCVDADLRSGRASEASADSAYGKGLRGILAGECNFRDAVGRVPAPSGDYYAVASGSPARPEALSSERMARLLKEMRASFDYIVVDSPSFPNVSDALVLAQKADLVLTVVRLENSPRKLTTEHAQKLAAAAPAYAAIVNDAGPSPRARYAAPDPNQADRGGKSGGKRSSGAPSRRRRAWWVAAGLTLTLVVLTLLTKPLTFAQSEQNRLQLQSAEAKALTARAATVP
jgi:tyrosine-protein kinase Etk/Wzc